MNYFEKVEVKEKEILFEVKRTNCEPHLWPVWDELVVVNQSCDYEVHVNSGVLMNISFWFVVMVVCFLFAYKTLIWVRSIFFD